MKQPGLSSDPLWFKDAIIYELHVKTFFDGNNDGIGDFAGLMQKLDYLQSLGVTCIWLLPFFPSPLRDDGYDIADYLNVHPSYGTTEDFRAFLEAAHARDLQVMIELVINHTSDQHPWFQAARAAPPGSPERNFYVWTDDDQLYKDARIIFTDTEKSNWTWDPVAKAYYWHRFFSHQPDLNYDNPIVLEEVLKVMNYWLDMGVDGLRLDAIPYLVERDGTNCENLAETHAVIKQFRKRMDETYDGRMILAEANQWPSDVIEYFGDGDECHMAFHFPLMPRIFMALRLEDRHPITDILDQTPAIPANCQWGIFLRNHDELTLEMVTDEERDYMYLAYSADPQMRINIGIRRRLAPLMDNNRRRMELLYSLLFSFPGTPIMYYGDEIGMGDNIYLGDRNGVRTPMQWSADRNAGFSRVNPAKLYSPPIMDPVYGYQSVNVEAQQEEPSSLLNWTRNMIALRKLFQVFGRGEIEFLRPENRKVLAYIRSHGDDRILCVANLSRFAQPAELDLTRFAGMSPVEMLGYVEFPKIGRTPYALTLAPYGFLWFELHGTPEAEAQAVPREDALVLDLAASSPWTSLFQGECKSKLEQGILPEFLQAQRWFGGKARAVRAVHVQDWGKLPDANAAFLLAGVEYAEGSPDTYLLPLSIATGEAARKLQQTAATAILGVVRLSGAEGVLYDATWDENACRAFLGALESEAQIPLSGGRIVAHSATALRGHAEPTSRLTPRRSSAEQSNTSILFGSEFILKLFRHLEYGQNPDCEIGRFLTEQAGFTGIPPFGGWMEYERPGEEPAAIAMLQGLVANQGDGWQATLEELRRYYERAATLEGTPAVDESASLWQLAAAAPTDAAREQVGLYYDAAVALGRKTAEMHLALASSDSDPDFAPQPFTKEDGQQLARDFSAHGTAVFDALKEALPRLPDELLESAGLVLSLRRKALARFAQFGSVTPEFQKIRIHGDYHLGQVLRVANDYVILDFEGEPARSLEQRRARHSPLKDVAGMLRSFSYAAHASLLTHATRWPEETARLEPWARSWERIVSAAFLRAYRDTAGAAAFLPRDEESFFRVLEAFLLDKALYELRYELNNRPTWVRIPLWGILSLDLGGGPHA